MGGCPVKQLESGCFANCTGLVRVYLPQTLETIASDAFAGCSNLRFAYFMGNAPTVVVSGERSSGDKLSASMFGPDVIVYYRAGTTGWDNPDWIDRAVGIIPGDFNGNESFNIPDAVAFVQWLAQLGSYTDSEFIAADLNRDGSVNMADIVKMVQALANPSIVLN